MDVCMYVWMYVCMHVCMYACMHACMHACMYVCMCVCVYACMHVCMSVCVYVCMSVNLCINTKINKNTHTYIYIHPYESHTHNIYIWYYIYKCLSLHIYIYMCIHSLEAPRRPWRDLKAVCSCTGCLKMKRKATSKSTGPQMASERPRRYLGDPAVGFVFGDGFKGTPAGNQGFWPCVFFRVFCKCSLKPVQWIIEVLLEIKFWGLLIL